MTDHVAPDYLLFHNGDNHVILRRQDIRGVIVEDDVTVLILHESDRGLDSRLGVAHSVEAVADALNAAVVPE